MYQQMYSHPPLTYPQTYHQECYDKLIQSQQKEENHPQCPVCYNKVKPGTGVTYYSTHPANSQETYHYEV